MLTQESSRAPLPPRAWSQPWSGWATGRWTVRGSHATTAASNSSSTCSFPTHTHRITTLNSDRCQPTRLLDSHWRWHATRLGSTLRWSSRLRKKSACGCHCRTVLRPSCSRPSRGLSAWQTRTPPTCTGYSTHGNRTHSAAKSARCASRLPLTGRSKSCDIPSWHQRARPNFCPPRLSHSVEAWSPVHRLGRFLTPGTRPALDADAIRRWPTGSMAARMAASPR